MLPLLISDWRSLKLSFVRLVLEPGRPFEKMMMKASVMTPTTTQGIQRLRGLPPLPPPPPEFRGGIEGRGGRFGGSGGRQPSWGLRLINAPGGHRFERCRFDAPSDRGRPRVRPCYDPLGMGPTRLNSPA